MEYILLSIFGMWSVVRMWRKNETPSTPGKTSAVKPGPRKHGYSLQFELCVVHGKTRKCLVFENGRTIQGIPLESNGCFHTAN